MHPNKCDCDDCSSIEENKKTNKYKRIGNKIRKLKNKTERKNRRKQRNK
jgi:hypothetical protein